MAREKQSVPAIFVKNLFGIIGLIIGLAFAAAAGYLLYEFEDEITDATVALVMGIVSVVLTLIIMIVLDVNDKFKQKMQKEQYNYRWLVIMPAALAFGLIVLVVYGIPSHVNYQYIEMTDIRHPPTMSFVVFVASYAVLLLAVLFLYFSIKNLRPVARVHKVKFPAFAVTNIAAVSLVVVIVVMFVVPAIDQSPTRFKDQYTYNDGPWVTFGSNASTEVSVSWLTSSRLDISLKIGTSPYSITTTHTGTGNAYLHKVDLTGLAPNTTYYYTIPITFSQAHASTTFTFKTAPATQEAFKFTVSGDKQPSSTSGMRHFNGAVVNGIIAQHPDFAMMVGDYASNGDYISDWHYSLESLARLGGTTPLGLAIGNHDHGDLNGQNFIDMFPYPYENVTRGKFYAYNYSNAHFLVIDSIALDGTYSNEQLAWIEADLAAANDTMEWKFAFFHYSPMSTGSCNMIYGLQAKLVPLFDKYQVDAVFYGHDHFYEHYSYTYGNENLVHAASHDTWMHHPVHYFVTGGGGGNLEAFGYNLLYREPEMVTRSWYNHTADANQSITYFKNPWNSNRYYSDGPASPDGRVYYQDPTIELYQEEITHFGYTYGENSYHYMLVEVSGTTCTISARHTDGSLMAGPGGANPQQYVLTHA